MSSIQSKRDSKICSFWFRKTQNDYKSHYPGDLIKLICPQFSIAPPEKIDSHAVGEWICLVTDHKLNQHGFFTENATTNGGNTGGGT